MCGRFVFASSLEQVAVWFDTPLPDFDMPPSYNVAPTANIVAVVSASNNNIEERQLGAFRWGLVPSWVKDPSAGPLLFNARSETAASKNSFRSAFKRRRCIVPADGFYEWPPAPQGTPRDKRPLPHYITRTDGDIAAMAALWECWSPSGQNAQNTPQSSSQSASVATGSVPGGVLHSAAVLTTSANEFMAPIHNRMPVLLERSSWEAWLDPTHHDTDALAALCRPADEGTLRSHQVGRAVGSVKNNDASLTGSAA